MPRQKLNRWNTAIAERLRPIWEAIKQEILASEYLQIDETPIRYLEPGHGKVKQGYLWIYNNPHGAVYYALNQWDKQLLHLTNGYLKIDNNLAENAVRPTKLGMKNWMFFGNAEAGWTRACIYTLVENCKRQGLNPEAYLKEILSHLPENPTPKRAAASSLLLSLLVLLEESRVLD